jgi:hypothetical protein
MAAYQQKADSRSSEPTTGTSAQLQTIINYTKSIETEPNAAHLGVFEIPVLS